MALCPVTGAETHHVWCRSVEVLAVEPDLLFGDIIYLFSVALGAVMVAVTIVDGDAAAALIFGGFLLFAVTTPLWARPDPTA
jgi:hypothetical protein